MKGLFKQAHLPQILIILANYFRVPTFVHGVACYKCDTNEKATYYDYDCMNHDPSRKALCPPDGIGCTVYITDSGDDGKGCMPTSSITCWKKIFGQELVEESCVSKSDLTVEEWNDFVDCCAAEKLQTETEDEETDTDAGGKPDDKKGNSTVSDVTKGKEGSKTKVKRSLRRKRSKSSSPSPISSSSGGNLSEPNAKEDYSWLGMKMKTEEEDEEESSRKSKLSKIQGRGFFSSSGTKRRKFTSSFSKITMCYCKENLCNAQSRLKNSDISERVFSSFAVKMNAPTNGVTILAVIILLKMAII